MFGRWHLILWVLEFTQWASDDLTVIHQIRLGSVSLRVGWTPSGQFLWSVLGSVEDAAIGEVHKFWHECFHISSWFSEIFVSVKFMMSVFVIRHHAFIAQSKNLFHSVCSSVSVGGTWRRNICINTSRKYLPAEQSSEIRLSVLFTLVILIDVAVWCKALQKNKTKTQTVTENHKRHVFSYKTLGVFLVWSVLALNEKHYTKRKVKAWRAGSSRLWSVVIWRYSD